MTARQKDQAFAVARWVALLCGFLFGVWKIDEHFVTRREFAELRDDVRIIAEELKQSSH